MSNARGRLAAVDMPRGGPIRVTIELTNTDGRDWQRIAHALGEEVTILDADAARRYRRSLPTVEDIAGILKEEP